MEGNKSYWIDIMRKSEEAIGSFRTANSKMAELKEKMVEELNKLRELKKQGDERLSKIDDKIKFLDNEKGQVQKQINLIEERIKEFENPL